MRCLCLFVILPMLVKCSGTDLKQERATVRRCNTKYLVECHGITRRLRRGEPYKTNLTAVTRYQSGNNITLKVVLNNGNPIEVLRSKLCDLPNIKWAWEYLQLYSNIGKCPVKPGTYGFYNMEFSPKNLPQIILNLVKGKFHVNFYFILTATEEILLEYSITLFG